MKTMLMTQTVFALIFTSLSDSATLISPHSTPSLLPSGWSWNDGPQL